MDSAEAKSKAVKPPQGGKAPKGSKSKSRPKKSQGLAESQAKNQNEYNDQSKQAHEVQEPESNDQPKQAHEVQKPENDNMQESGKKDESKKVPEAQKAQLVKSGRLPRGQLRDWSSYTPNPPTKAELKANGRQKGRILIPWGRPRMLEKLLLHIQYETEMLGKQGSLPWDRIAHRLSPGSSGTAITQMLGRARNVLINEGFMVPPYPQKPGGPCEPPEVRGLIRAFPLSTDSRATRRVAWNEECDDPTEPLANATYLARNQTAEEEDYDDGELNDGELSDTVAGDEAAGQPSASKLGQRGSVNEAHPARSKKRGYYAEGEEEFSDLGMDEELGIHDVGGSKRARMSGVAGYASGVQPGAARSAPASEGGHSSGFHNRGAGLGAGQNTYQGGGQMGGYPVPDMVAPQHSTPPRSNLHPAFTTVESSPDSFDFANASPRHQQMYFAHLAEYNSPNALRNIGCDEQTLSQLYGPGEVPAAPGGNTLQMIGGGHQVGQKMAAEATSIDPSLLNNAFSRSSASGALASGHLAPGNASVTKTGGMSNMPVMNSVMPPMPGSAMMGNTIPSNAMFNDPFANNLTVGNNHMLNAPMVSSMSNNTMSNNADASNLTMSGDAQGTDGVFINMRMADGVLVEAPEPQRPAARHAMPEAYKGL